jgi:hypothetical protein
MGVRRDASWEEIAEALDLGVPRIQNQKLQEGGIYVVAGTNPESNCWVRIYVDGKTEGAWRVKRYTPITEILEWAHTDVHRIKTLEINGSQYAHWRRGGWPENAELTLTMEKQLTVRLRAWGHVIRGRNEPRGEPVTNRWTNFQVMVDRGSTKERLRELWQAEQIACSEIIREGEIIDAQDPWIPEESIDGLDEETPVEILWQEGNSTVSRWVSRKFKGLVGQRAPD